MWNRLSTYEYIVRQRHRQDSRDSRKAAGPVKETTAPPGNLIKVSDAALTAVSWGVRCLVWFFSGLKDWHWFPSSSLSCWVSVFRADFEIQCKCKTHSSADILHLHRVAAPRRNSVLKLKGCLMSSCFYLFSQISQLCLRRLHDFVCPQTLDLGPKELSKTIICRLLVAQILSRVKSASCRQKDCLVWKLHKSHPEQHTAQHCLSVIKAKLCKD